MNMPAQAKRPGKLAVWFTKYKFYYLLALPGILYLLIFKYAPMFGIVIAFKDYDAFSGIAGIFTAPWVGFENFARFFNSYYFGRIMGNTLIISFYKLLFGFPAPILLALLLNEMRFMRAKKCIQTISYVPYFISWVIVASLLNSILTTDNGLVNVVLNKLGFRSISFMTNPKYFRGVLVVSDIWKSVGYGSIVYLAAISGVSQEQYEAAELDGATRLQRIWHVNLPSILPTITIMLILQMGTLMSVGHDKALLMQNALNLEASELISTYVYKIGLQKAQYSLSAAVGMVNSLVNVALMLTMNWIVKKMGQVTAV